MTTALYLRISEDPRNTELGVDRQRELCEGVAERRGWLDVTTYVDNDISATTGKHRPGYAALMAAVDRGEVRRVVCYHLSRVWRNRRERADGIERMRRVGVTVACARGPELDMSTAYGRAIAEVAGAFDSLESEIKSERLIDEHAQHARRGQPPRARRLYGYSADGMTMIEAEAANVKRWYDELLAGATLASLAREAGVGHATMRLRFQTPTYAALRVRDGIEYPGVWPAIVAVDVWRAAVSLLDSRQVGPHNAQRLLSALAACKRCGTTVVSTVRKHSGVPMPAYRCERCGRVWRRLDVDAFVDALVRERLGRTDARAMLAPPGQDRTELLDQAAKLRAGLRVLAATAFSGVEGVVEQAEAARAELHRIEARLAGAPADPLWQLLDSDDPVGAYAGLDDTPRRQAVIRGLMTVTLDAPPRGRKCRSLTPDQMTAAYVATCVEIEWNHPA